MTAEEYWKRAYARACNEASLPPGTSPTDHHLDQVVGAAVTFLTTAHTAMAFGVLAALASDRSLAASPLLQAALSYALVGLVLVGVYLHVTWHHLQNFLQAPDMTPADWVASQMKLGARRSFASYCSFLLFVVSSTAAVIAILTT